MLDLRSLLKSAPLGDARLSARALTLVTAILEGQASATHGPEGVGHTAPWAHAMGVYRFFNNDKLTLPALYQPCQVALQQLVPSGQRCYVVHDVSVVDYTGHEANNDLIAVGNNRGYGYELYTALVLNEAGRPVGPLVQEVRTERGLLSSQSATPIAFVDHMTQVERAIDATGRLLPEREAVHLCDREFDELQLLRFLQGERGQYIIRAQHLGRRIMHKGQRTTLSKVAGLVPLQKAATVEREGKSYNLFVGQTEVLFDGKSLRGVARKRQKPKGGLPLPVRVVISELRREGQAPLRWILLTNLEDDGLVVVQAYVWRWRVERFFYLNKVGLRLEQWRQETGERIARRLAISQLAAMAIYQMQAAVATDPEAGDLLKTLATLGGWLGRKQDPIGPIVLMRGMMLVLGMVSALQEYGEDKLRDVALKLTRYLGLPGLPGPPTGKSPRRRRCV